eukprot:COSAG02_NODE_8897_length_2405_cov_2.497398_2_plen_168_part_00
MLTAVGCVHITDVLSPQIMAMQHQYYGNVRTLERKWPSLVRYQENLITTAESASGNATQHEGLAVCDQFKDWLCGNAQSCCTHPSAKGAPEPPNCRVVGLRWAVLVMFLASAQCRTWRMFWATAVLLLVTLISLAKVRRNFILSSTTRPLGATVATSVPSSRYRCQR